MCEIWPRCIFIVTKRYWKQIGRTQRPLSIFRTKITSAFCCFLKIGKKVKIKLKGSMHNYIVSPKWWYYYLNLNQISWGTYGCHKEPTVQIWHKKSNFPYIFQLKNHVCLLWLLEKLSKLSSNRYLWLSQSFFHRDKVWQASESAS